MAGSLPYVNQPGSIVKILEKARDAKTPDRFTVDFLETKLGFKGGNYRQFIPFAKKLGMLNSDGTPSDLYKAWRNSSTAKAAMAQAIKAGYREAFERNEYANSLGKDAFKGLVVEITGDASNSRVVQLVCQTFESLKKLADFEAEPSSETETEAHGTSQEGSAQVGANIQAGARLGLGLSYTINLVLPKTDDAAVFNAIFKALRDNLLRT